MEEQAILALGTVTLTGCGAGLLLIHQGKPLLRGLNLMGVAILIGGIGAAVLLAGMRFALLQPIGIVCILLGFVYCHQALLCVAGRKSDWGLLTVGTLACQTGVTVLQWMGAVNQKSSVIIFSLALVLVLETTARVADADFSGHARSSARVHAGLLRLLAVASALRALATATGWLRSPIKAYWAETVTYGLFIAAAIGLSFIFFSLTTIKLTDELEHMASTDPLTRVYNRRVFLQWCERELDRSQGGGTPFSILLLDFDHFKRINDSFGHHSGDKVLCAAVEKIQDSIRGLDVLCRWGGEEFAVLLPNAPMEATLIVAERIRTNIRMVHPSVLDASEFEQRSFQLSVSVGAATYDGGSDQVAAMLQRADAALYAAKHAGRDRVVLAPRRVEKWAGTQHDDPRGPEGLTLSFETPTT